MDDNIREYNINFDYYTCHFELDGATGNIIIYTEERYKIETLNKSNSTQSNQKIFTGPSGQQMRKMLS